MNLNRLGQAFTRRSSRDGQGTDNSYLPAMEKEQRPAFSSGLVTGFLILSWYTTNIGVLLLNKYLLSNYGYKYPIFLTMCHMAACSILAYISVVWMKITPLQVRPKGGLPSLTRGLGCSASRHAADTYHAPHIDKLLRSVTNLGRQQGRHGQRR